MSKDFQVTVTNPERAAEWEKILGTATLPVKSPIPTPVLLPTVGKARIYELDLDLITDEQRQNLIVHIAQKFSLDPRDVEQGLEEHGVPLLADDCIVAVFNPNKWF